MSRVSKIRIVNHTGYDLAVIACLNNRGDWEDNLSPEDVLDGKTVHDGETLLEKVEYHNKLSASNATYNLKFVYSGCDKQSFCITTGSIRQVDATGDKMSLSILMAKESAEVFPCTIITTPYAKQGNLNIPVMSIYLCKKRKSFSERKEMDTLKFFAFGDPHFRTDEDEEDPGSNLQRQYRLRDNMMARKDYWLADFVFILGDLVNRDAKSSYLKLYQAVWPQELCNAPANHPILCDGYGNHDLKKEKDDTIVPIIQERNDSRRKAMSNNGFATDAENLHYRWWIERTIPSSDMTNSLCQRIHFFVLNLAPTRGETDKDKYEKHSHNALGFLKTSLKSIPAYEPIFLFHHYGFQLPNTDDPSRWWSVDERKEYLMTLSNYTVGGIYYGHAHCNINGNNYKNLGVSKQPQSMDCGNGNSGDYMYVMAQLSEDGYASHMKVKCVTYVPGDSANKVIQIQDTLNTLKESAPAIINDINDATPYVVTWQNGVAPVRGSD